MVTKTIQITEITVDELADKIAEKLFSKMNKLSNKIIDSKTDALLTRKETASYFSISLPTVHQWAKDGIINPIRVGHRIYFKKQSILNLVDKRTLNYTIKRNNKIR
tara:strand:- start:7273 stop:7590 length:318 start_codon:yes stop_codon:yes gene_type:complete